MRRWMAMSWLWGAALACAPADVPPRLPEPPSAATVASPGAPGPDEAPRERMVLRDPAPDGETWPSVAPEEAGFDRAALEQILERATATASSSLIILREGKVVVERYFDQPLRPIETMSATKSVVSIAVGILIDEGKIRSVDEPLSVWYPEFAQGKKAKITLRHLLTHSSGLSHGRGAGDMNKEKDRLKYARSRDVVSEPGTVFSYNNEATQLLSGIIEQAAGRPADAYLAERLFAPLAIRQWHWARDEAGNVQTFYGLSLHARDLAKIGMLLANHGSYAGVEVVSPGWVRASTSAAAPSEYHGYLWWLRFGEGTVAVTKERLTRLAERGFVGATSLEPLIGRRFPATSEREAFWLEVGARLDRDSRGRLSALAREGLAPYDVEPGAPFGFAADGWLGQQLIVVPAANVVAVRQHEAPKNVMTDDAYNQKVGYFTFPRDLERALVNAQKP